MLPEIKSLYRLILKEKIKISQRTVDHSYYRDMYEFLWNERAYCIRLFSPRKFTYERKVIELEQ